MRRSGTFWGLILIVVGGLLLLANLGVLRVNVWQIIWPAVLITLGLWFLWGAMRGPRAQPAEQMSIPLEGAGRARLRLHHGAGVLRLSAGAAAGELLNGEFVGGLDHRAERTGETLEVDMRVPSSAVPDFFFPWLRPGSTLDWTLRLTDEIPLGVDIETGASDLKLDLSALRVEDLRLKTGASATDLTLPARAGFTRVRIESGAASVRVRVPEGVAARIHLRQALAGVNVDQNRFPRTADGYQSPDYEQAANRVELTVETGVASITIG